MNRLVVLIVVLLLVSNDLASTAQAAPASGRAVQLPYNPNLRTTNMNSPTTLVPDDGDVAQELKYPWQDATFSHDEQRQIGYMFIFLIGAAGAGLISRVRRSRHYAAYASEDRGHA